MADFQKLKAINQAQTQLARDEIQKTEEKLSTIQLQETIVRVARSMVDFIEGNTTKTVVLNQIKDFATSQDADKLTQSVESLHNTLKTHENTDITPLTEVMNRVLKEVSDLPKENIEIPEQKFVDYSDQLKSLTQAVDVINKSIKAQKLHVEAPQVNVEAPTVNVKAPDLKPLAKELDKAFKAAIKGITIPKPESLKKTEDELKKQTKLLKDIRDTPSGGGGGGSGSIAPFLVDNALPVAPNGLVPEAHDYIALTYVAAGNGAGEVETATYKTGGSGGTTVATLTLTYNASDEVATVTRS